MTLDNQANQQTTPPPEIEVDKASEVEKPLYPGPYFSNEFLQDAPINNGVYELHNWLLFGLEHEVRTQVSERLFPEGNVNLGIKIALEVPYMKLFIKEMLGKEILRVAAPLSEYVDLLARIARLGPMTPENEVKRKKLFQTPENLKARVHQMRTVLTSLGLSEEMAALD